jgi:uncharacterized protein YcaQ
MDAKADRKQKVLTVHNLHFESVKLSKPETAKIVEAINRFAQFNQCKTVVIKKCNNKQQLTAIRAGLKE